MKKLILLFGLSILGYSASCQSDFQIKNLAAFCKYWGFLKYYHPASSRKNIDWDTVLVNNYQKVKAAKSKEEFNSILLSISNSLGELKPTKHPFTPSDSVSINADFKWMDDTTILSSQICAYLKKVKENHRPFRSKYVGPDLIRGATKLKEKPYPEMVYPIEAYRFLSLARYWNIINYYFPDKYLMDYDWNISLEKATPIFLNATDKEGYYRAIEWITARTDDSHGSIVNAPYIDSTYKSPPIRAFYYDDTLFIKYTPRDSVSNRFNIKKGDAIISVDGKPVKDIYRDAREHHSFSNEGQAQYFGSFLSISSMQDTSIFIIIRDGKELKVKIRNYTMKELMAFWNSSVQKHFNSNYILTDTISRKKYGYLNMGILKKKEINNFFKKTKDVDYLVIDIRNYPRYDAWPSLANKLISGKKRVAMYTKPDYRHPGYINYYRHFVITTFSETLGRTGNPDYKGKVILLINHYTQSEAEYETMALSLAPNTTIIGTQTAGADGNVSTVIFPGNYSVWFTGLGWYYADGRQTQRIGITPDIKVEYTIQSYLNGTDPIMQRALEFIRTGK